VISGWNYVTYFKVDGVTIPSNDARITYVNFTLHGNGWQESETANATATLTFTGSTVELWGEKPPYGGMGTMTLDGVVQTPNLSFTGGGGTQLIWLKTNACP
jgi:hypothetical protein